MALFIPNIPRISNDPNFNSAVFQPPPFITTYYKYQDVNNDINLQEKVTLRFLKRTIKFLNEKSDYKHLKNKFLNKLKSEDGYDIMHRMLKLFVKRGDTNWYDLREQYDLVDRYIKHKLSEY